MAVSPYPPHKPGPSGDVAATTAHRQKRSGQTAAPAAVRLSGPRARPPATDLLVFSACWGRPASDAELGTSCTSSMRDMAPRAGPSSAPPQVSKPTVITLAAELPLRCPSGAEPVTGSLFEICA